MKSRERVIMMESDRVTTSKQATVTISCASARLVSTSLIISAGRTAVTCPGS